jgi:hypothetical protein
MMFIVWACVRVGCARMAQWNLDRRVMSKVFLYDIDQVRQKGGSEDRENKIRPETAGREMVLEVQG